MELKGLQLPQAAPCCQRQYCKGAILGPQRGCGNRPLAGPVCCLRVDSCGTGSLYAIALLTAISARFAAIALTCGGPVSDVSLLYNSTAALIGDEIRPSQWPAAGSR